MALKPDSRDFVFPRSSPSFIHIIIPYLHKLIISGNDSNRASAVPRDADAGVPPRGSVGAQRRVGKEEEAKIFAPPPQDAQEVCC